VDCGLWIPSSMHFVWDYYLCLDAEIQGSQVSEDSIQREIANISR